MSRKLYVLGKSNYALAIIFDMLKLLSVTSDVVVVRNIPEDENSSSSFTFDNGIPHSLIDLPQFSPSPKDEFIIGSIGKSRKSIKNFFEEKYSIKTKQYVSLVHPSAVIADSVELGKGIHIGPLSVLAPFVQLGDHCTVNRNVSIGHHTKLKDFACVNPGATVAGLCNIGRNTIVGAGSTVTDGITIGSESLIGAASLVTKSIPGKAVFYGSPAKFVRKNEA